MEGGSAGDPPGRSKDTGRGWNGELREGRQPVRAAPWSQLLQRVPED